MTFCVMDKVFEGPQVILNENLPIVVNTETNFRTSFVDEKVDSYTSHIYTLEVINLSPSNPIVLDYYSYRALATFFSLPLCWPPLCCF